MQAIFMARGPSFNQNVQINSINNVDIYHIACRILNLNPNPNATAGSLVNLTNIFRAVENVSTTGSSTASASILSTSTTSTLTLTSSTASASISSSSETVKDNGCSSFFSYGLFPVLFMLFLVSFNF
jgi:hypothetical protein